MKKLVPFILAAAILSGCCSSKKDQTPATEDNDELKPVMIQESTARPGEGGGSGTREALKTLQ